MRKEEYNKMTLTEKLVKVQSNLKANKTQHNNFGNYDYRSAEDILTAVKPLLAENGLTLTITDDIALIGERYYIKATATVSDGENSVSTTAFAREAELKKGMDESQITGSASSYARKYAMNGLFAIDDNKYADTLNDKQEDAPKPVKKDGAYMRDGLQKCVAAICGEKPENIPTALMMFTTNKAKGITGVDSIDKMTDAQVQVAYGNAKKEYKKRFGTDFIHQ